MTSNINAAWNTYDDNVHCEYVLNDQVCGDENSNFPLKFNEVCTPVNSSNYDKFCKSKIMKPIENYKSIVENRLFKISKKIFNHIDKKSTGFIYIGKEKVDFNSFLNLIKKNNMFEELKKDFYYLTQNMLTIELDHVKNYLKIKKNASEDIINKAIKIENLENHLDFYDFVGLVFAVGKLKFI